METQRRQELERLLSPFELGRVTLRNRIFSPPHGTYYAQGFSVSEQELAYYGERARGGVGLIVAGNWQVWPRVLSAPSENFANQPGALDGHKRLADAVHHHGTAIAAQLHISGRLASTAWSRKPLLAPSPLADPQRREIPKELEPWEIEEMIECYGRGAAAMAEAGWDGVEILAAQGYGLSQFLSPGINRRTDEWGGSTENRLRVILRILEAVRTAVGEALFVGLRLNASDFVEGGLELDEALEIVRLLDAAGQLDYLNVSGAGSENWPLWIADMSHELGLFVPYAARIREVTSLSLAVVTRIKDPLQAESVLAHGHADLVGMNRPLIADPEMPRKAASGRLTDVRPCIYCNQGCVERSAQGQSMSCTVNPAVGREALVGVQHIRPAAAPKRVVVVGGGPAGLQAATLAASRGHSLVLYEERDVLGGQIEVAARTPSRRELGEIIRYFSDQAAAHGVEVRLGQRAAASDVLSHDPDAVVVATGSAPVTSGYASFRPAVEAIPGHDLDHVTTAAAAIQAADRVGRRVLIVEDDPHVQATTAAEFFSGLGREVTIVTREPVAGLSIGTANHAFLYKRLYGAGVEIIANSWIDEITPSGATGYHIYSGERMRLDGFETVILATGNAVRQELYYELRSVAPEVAATRVGDCLAPRMLDNAIWDAFHVALEL